MILAHALCMWVGFGEQFFQKKSYFFAKSGRGGVNGLKNVHFLALLGRFLFWSETSPRGCADPIYAFWAEIGRTLIGSKKVVLGPRPTRLEIAIMKRKKNE